MKQEIKEMVAVSYNFDKKYLQNLKRDKSYLLTVSEQILQTKRLSNPSSAYIARYSLKLL